ncbi:nitroreductase family deazaflavin-dependent oxidoreductase [Streptomyces sp. MSC1_001]
MPDFNQQVIEEFRANGGRVGGMFEGASLLLLTTTGARSGRARTNPAVYVRDGARLLVFASNAGGPKHPAWFHNLSADPHVTVELGTPEGTVERFAATAVVTEGAERDRLYAGQADRDPGFAAYQAATDRLIPVVALHRVDLGDPARHRAIADHLVKVHAELRAELTALREGLDSAATEVAGTVGGVGAVGRGGRGGRRLGGEGHPAARPPARPPLPDLLRRAARPPPQRGRRLRPPGARVPRAVRRDGPDA